MNVAVVGLFPGQFSLVRKKLRGLEQEKGLKLRYLGREYRGQRIPREGVIILLTRFIKHPVQRALGEARAQGRVYFSNGSVSGVVEKIKEILNGAK